MLVWTTGSKVDLIAAANSNIRLKESCQTYTQCGSILLHFEEQKSKVNSLVASATPSSFSRAERRDVDLDI